MRNFLTRVVLFSTAVLLTAPALAGDPLDSNDGPSLLVSFWDWVIGLLI